MSEMDAEFDKRVDAFKPETLSHVDWRASSARCEIALKLWLKDTAPIFARHLEALASREQNEGWRS